MAGSKINFQVVWGIALFLAGCGVFFRTYLLHEKINAVAGQPVTALFIRVCLYIMGTLLIGGGLKKLHHHYIESKEQTDR